MEKNISMWLHKINHEIEASYALADKGFLSIGWRGKDSSVLEAAREGNTELFRQLMENTSKSKWYL